MWADGRSELSSNRRPLEFSRKLAYIALWNSRQTVVIFKEASFYSPLELSSNRRPLEFSRKLAYIALWNSRQTVVLRSSEGS